MSATLHNLPDTCAIAGKVGIAANLPILQARDGCVITGRNFVSARLPIQEARDTCLIQGNITFKTTANLNLQEARDSCAIAGAGAGDNFDVRKTSPGVIRFFDFDTADELGGDYLANFGTTPGDTYPGPVRDTVIKKSGASSIRFDRVTGSGSDAAGSWFSNFSADLQTQFGANSHFFVQIAIRWNSVLANTTMYQSAYQRLQAVYVNATTVDLAGDQRIFLTGANQLVWTSIQAQDFTTRVYSAVQSSSYNSGTNTTRVVLILNSGAINPALDNLVAETGSAAAITYPVTPTIVNGTTLTVPGDYTYGSTLNQGYGCVRLRSTANSKVVHGIMFPATYNSGTNTTTITLIEATGTLDASLNIMDGCKLQGGKKWFDVNTGDILGGPAPQNGITHFYSSADGKLVVQSYYQEKALFMYRYVNSNVTGKADTGLFQPFGSSFMLQNAIPSPYCLYDTGSTPASVPPNCWSMPADTWITFQLEVKVGNLTTREGHYIWDNSEVRLWVCEDDQPSLLLINYTPSVPGYIGLLADDSDYPGTSFERFGKVYLFPYLTFQDVTQVLPGTASAWYDELIISTQQIPNPSSSTVAFPAWRTGMTVGQFSAIAGTSIQSSGVAPPRSEDQGNIIIPWTGGCADNEGGIYYFICPGGHGDSSYNGAIKINLAQDAPGWATLIARSSVANTPTAPAADAGNLYYYYDGHPCSRHTYYSPQHIGARNMLYLPVASARWGSSGPSGSFNDAFHLDTLAFDPAGTWPNAPNMASPVPMFAKHPVTEDIWACSNSGAWQRWVQATGTWTLFSPPGSPVGWDNFPALIDVYNGRNRLIGIHGNGVISCMDLTTLVSSTVAMSGVSISIAEATYAGFVYDADNDRYILVSYLGHVFAITPTGVVTQLTSTVAAETPDGQNNGVFTRLASYPNLGGILYIPAYASNVYFMPTR